MPLYIASFFMPCFFSFKAEKFIVGSSSDPQHLVKVSLLVLAWFRLYNLILILVKAAYAIVSD